VKDSNIANIIEADSGLEYPWDLHKIPNFQFSKRVAVVDAMDINERLFHTRYVLKNLPCLIKGAVKHWPAFQKWKNPDYILSVIGDVEVRASCEPKLEAFGLRSAELDMKVSNTTQDRLLPADTIRRILPKLRAGDHEVLFIEIFPSDPKVRCLGTDLLIEGSRFPFLRKPQRPRFLYSVWGAMLYKNSYSDWHFHPATEAIMCQVLGTKDVLLLAPTREHWDTLVPIHRERWKVYNVDLARFPSYRDVQPYHVVVEPGDGLFIPINWWHAVQGRAREFGITVPVTWNSPCYDLRQPANQYFLRMLWQLRRPLAAAVFVEATYQTMKNVIRRAVGL
jgi:hypothetical protein